MTSSDDLPARPSLQDLTRRVYGELCAQAVADARRMFHVPPTLAAVVVADAPPRQMGTVDLHTLEVLDARQAMHQMRAHVLQVPETYAFIFLSTGTVIVEREPPLPPQIAPALLCLWCTATEAGGESYLLQSSPTGANVEDPRPAPQCVCDAYRRVFDLTAPLPRPRGGVVGG